MPIIHISIDWCYYNRKLHEYYQTQIIFPIPIGFLEQRGSKIPIPAFRKIRYKKIFGGLTNIRGRITIINNNAYKEALNAAKKEVRKSKCNFEHKLAQI